MDDGTEVKSHKGIDINHLPGWGGIGGLMSHDAL